MEESGRLKNASRNIIFGVILRVYQLLVPFLIRTIMIKVLGVEYVGLNSLFVSVLQVLNLVELGVGAAMTFSMYEPVVNHDIAMINALLNLYKKYYRFIGSIVLLIGLLIVPFIPNLISGSIPNDMNIYILYLINLSATVLSYWLYAYRNSIFMAHQRVDITSKIMIFTETIKYIFQIVSIVWFQNYYLFVIVLVITQILTNLITAHLSRYYYPVYDGKGVIEKNEEKKIQQRIKDLFTAKLGGVILTSSDTIVISAFLGLKALALYQNYFYLITAVTSLLLIVFNSVTAGIGHSLITESREKNFSDLNKFTLIITWISGVAVVCFLNLFQPFMILWVGKDYLLPYSIVICFCIYFFISEINQLLNTYKDAAGIWRSDRFRPLITAGINLTLNLILVKIIGLYGVILSTVIATAFVGMPWLIHNLFSTLFDYHLIWKYVKKLMYLFIIVLLVAFITVYICSYIQINNIFIQLVVKFLSCILISNVTFFIAFFKLQDFDGVITIVRRVFKNNY